MAKNDHIAEFLDYYINLTVSPEYAVLLTGEWGVGKTWFIKQYLSDKNVPHLYASLNGISAFSEIEDQFFEQLHPVLASKSMKIASKILKGILKTAIHVDLDGDGKSDGSVSSTIPDISIPDYLKGVDKKILIFDDLERCLVPTPSILGYINQFVESKGLKVVILANELEIVKADELNVEKSKQYLIIKEKVIGRSFNLLSEPTVAIIQFQTQVNDRRIKEILNANTEVILEIYESAGYHNLRHLRQAILDFERFLKYMPDIMFENEKLLQHVISLYFLISIELRKGHITYVDLPILLNPFLSTKSNNSSAAIPIKGKYLILTNRFSPILDEDWLSFFKIGFINRDSVFSSLMQSTYFVKQNEPEWQKLWRYFELDDQEFEELRDKVFAEFERLEGRDSHVIIQETGIFLRLAKQRLLNCTEEKIIESGKENLRFCKQNVGLRLPAPFEDYPSTSSHGLQYLSLENPSFLIFLNFAKNLMQEYIAENANRSVDTLLDALRNSVADFVDLICISNSSSGKFADTPVLHHIEIYEFLNVYLSLSSIDKVQLSNGIERRYQFDDYSRLLTRELAWLINLRKTIEDSKSEGIQSLSRVLLEVGFSSVLDKSILKLRSLEDMDDNTSLT